MNTPAAIPEPASAPASASAELMWVDEFIRRVRPYVCVRATDGLLIKRPNQAQKLNPSGVRILQALLAGDSICCLLHRLGDDPAKTRQVSLFLRDVRRFLEGSLIAEQAGPAVELQPLAQNFSPLPVLSEIAVTYRCNLRCRFCYAGCNRLPNPVADSREMSAAQVVRILDKIRDQAQVPSVSFTGGEPTLRPELPHWIAAAKARDFRVNLITNGTRIDPAFARRLAEAGLDSAQVSLEAPDAVLHDAITGVAGSFAHAAAAVEHLATAGIHVHTNTTILRDNLKACSRMPAFVHDRLGRDRLSMNLVIPTGSAATQADLTIAYREIGPILETILAESRRCRVEFMWYSPTPLCLFNPIPKGLGNKGCAACDGLLSIAPNGAVLPCSSFPEAVGNLLESDFAEVWQSARARRYREKALAPPTCQQCEHLAVCHGACPLYWRAMGCSELPSLCTPPPSPRR